jgi:hypothetical protein
MLGREAGSVEMLVLSRLHNSAERRAASGPPIPANLMRKLVRL